MKKGDEDYFSQKLCAPIKDYDNSPHGGLTAAWLAQLVERQSAVREVDGSSPRPDQHSGS